MLFHLTDLNNVFFQLEIHRDITTITTPKELLKFKRLPFRIKMALAVCRWWIFSDLLGVYAYLDDIVILSTETWYPLAHSTTPTRSRLETQSWEMLICMEINQILQLQINQILPRHFNWSRTIDYQYYSQHAETTSVPEVQSFLGMVKHYGKFIPHLHQLKHLRKKAYS